MMDMQPGEVTKTWSDSTLLDQLTGFRPATPLARGVAAFVDWYREQYAVPRQLPGAPKAGAPNPGAPSI